MKSDFHSIMKKLYNNFDYVTCFLIALIILIPKMPFIKVSGIYINIRIEDFIVALFYGLWGIGLIFKQIKVPRTRLEVPMAIFLSVALLSVFLGIIRNTIRPFLGFLYFMRYVEYFGIFFLILSSFKYERLSKYIRVVVAIFIAVIIYGLLNRFSLAPMFRTMDSAGYMFYFKDMNFVQSTFGGHYDFGAYVMMSIPLILSILVISKKRILKFFYGLLLVVSVYLIFYAYARSGYLSLLSALVVWFFLQKSRLIVIPIFEFIRVGYLYIGGKFSKYQYKFSIDVGAKLMEKWDHLTSNIASHMLSLSKTTTTFQQSISIEETINETVRETTSSITIQQPTPTLTPLVQSSASTQINSNPQPTIIESLPLNGSGQQKLDYEDDLKINDNVSITLDPSAAIRFNMWKDHLKNDFFPNPILGKGLSSIGAGADGDYIRWLSEMGLCGFFAFWYLLFSLFRIIYRTYRQEENLFIKYIFLAFVSMFIGFMVNAIFIDVFEASKIAFYFWFLMGLAVGYSNYKEHSI